MTKLLFFNLAISRFCNTYIVLLINSDIIHSQCSEVRTRNIRRHFKSYRMGIALFAVSIDKIPVSRTYHDLVSRELLASTYWGGG